MAKGYTPPSEYGATGLRQFSGYVREEALRELSGPLGMRMYREMSENNAVIGAILFATEMLLRSVPFRVEPEDKANADDIAAGEFVTECMSDMEQPWAHILADVLGFIKYGYHVREICFKVRGGENPENPDLNSRYDDGLIGWRKWAPRPPETVLHWVFNDAGNAVALVQLLPTGGPLLTVPLDKCMHFTTTINKSNPEGRSSLRSSYVSYYYVKRIQEIEAIGIERDLCGVPVAWIPMEVMDPNAPPQKKQQYEAWKAAVRDVSRNAQEGFVFPLLFDKEKNQLYKFELMKSAGTRSFDTTKIIDRYDMRIAMTFLADWLTLGQGSTGGRASTGQSKNKTDMFSKAIGGYLDLISAELNRKAVPDLLSINSMKGRCIITHGDVSRTDIVDLSTAVMQLVQVGVFTPDPDLEAHLRNEFGLPQQDGEASDELNEGGSSQDADNADTQGGDTDNGTPQGDGQEQATVDDE